MSNHDLIHRAAVVAETIKALKEAGSWCGETHVQKATYLLQHAAGVDLGYDFVIYKHGPYSFDLATDLATLKSAHVVEFVVPVQGYGPSLELSNTGEMAFGSMKNFVKQFLPKIRFIANWFGNNDVRILERLATAHYVRAQNPSEHRNISAAKLRGLKPHISEPDALDAVKQVDEKLGALAVA